MQQHVEQHLPSDAPPTVPQRLSLRAEQRAVGPLQTAKPLGDSCQKPTKYVPGSMNLTVTCTEQELGLRLHSFSKFTS